MTHDYILRNAAENWLWFGSALDYAPIATDRWSKAVIQRGVKSLQGISALDTRVASALQEFDIPGLEMAPMREVARLRSSEEAFAEFRSAFEQVLRFVIQEEPSNERSFHAELARTSASIMEPKVIEIERRRRQSPAIDQLLSGVLSISAAMIEHAVTDMFPVGTTLTTIAGHGTWLLSRLRGKLTKEAREEALVREFCGYLMPKRRSR